MSQESVVGYMQCETMNSARCVALAALVANNSFEVPRGKLYGCNGKNRNTVGT